jgi:uncharacterized membrane protein HdeD (DUF308 family)
MDRKFRTRIDLDAKSVMRRLRRAFLWTGMVMAALGLVALIMPTFSSLVLELMIGWLLLISGFVFVVGAFSLRGTGLFLLNSP